MIYCKDCKKFAILEKVRINGFDEIVTTIGSCKHCGYEHEEGKVEYTDWEELGIDR